MINSGLKTLVEKSSSNKILKIYVKKEGAYADADTSVWAGVRKNIRKIIKYFAE